MKRSGMTRRISAPRALVGLAAAACVVTAGCTPLTALSHGKSSAPSPNGRLAFAAVADSYVSAGAAHQNTGSNPKIVSSAAGSGSTDKTAYVKFVVRGIPTGAKVTAQLKLRRTDHHLPASLRISKTGSNWSEHGITHANAPVVGTAVAAPRTSAAQTLTVDVSRAVRGNGAVTFTITDPVAASTAIFYSRESGAKAPQLVVNYKRTKTSAVTVPAPNKPNPTTPNPGGGCSISATLVPSCGVWWGIGANPLAGESWDQALVNFENTQGRLSDLLHYYHVGAATFPTPGEIARASQGGRNRILLENWKPEQGRTWAQVAAGDPTVDAAIDREAAYLKSHYWAKFFLAIHHEPEDEVNPAAGSGYTAQDYRAMYRHVVQRLRADGVSNAVTVMDYMGAPKWGSQSWFNDLYPGDDVVDWIAEDPYSIGTSAPWRADFGGMVDRRDGSGFPGFYSWATSRHPGKPIMLAEWGVTENPNNGGSKTAFFNSMLSDLRSYPAIKALVYWNAPSFPALANGATRIDSSSSALAAFRQLSQAGIFNSPRP